MKVLAVCALSVLPSVLATRTVADCVANLNCTLTELCALSIVQRKDVVAQIQATYGPQFNASDRWNNVLGTVIPWASGDVRNVTITLKV